MSAHGPEHGSEHGHGDDKGWADSKAFRRGFLAALILVALTAAALGFIPAFQNPHAHFTGEHMPAFWGMLWRAGLPIFFALYGFVMFSLIVLVGQHLRKIVGRDERYYDERE